LPRAGTLRAVGAKPWTYVHPVKKEKGYLWDDFEQEFNGENLLFERTLQR
jgi:hypothetical protein